MFLQRSEDEPISYVLFANGTKCPVELRVALRTGLPAFEFVQNCISAPLVREVNLIAADL